MSTDKYHEMVRKDKRWYMYALEACGKRPSGEEIRNCNLETLFTCILSLFFSAQNYDISRMYAAFVGSPATEVKLYL